MNRAASASTLDAIASAITPSLLQPYAAPLRPFLLGALPNYCIRPGYVARAEAAVPSASLTADGGTMALATAIANALGSSILADIDWMRPDTALTEHRLSPNLVVVCDDVLQRLADPVPLLARLRLLTRESAIVVLGTSVRQLTVAGDDPGPPAEAGYVREWTFPELHAFLDASGLDPVFGGLLPPDASTNTSARAAFVLIGER